MATEVIPKEVRVRAVVERDLEGLRILHRPILQAVWFTSTDHGHSNTDTKTTSELSFQTERYSSAIESWPQTGRHILAQVEGDAILVYQAFKPSIGKYAVRNQCFEGCKDYKPHRMTWIKTNFLWMMYRSGWASKTNQEMILGIWLKRKFFHKVLLHAKSTHKSAKSRNNKNQKLKMSGKLQTLGQPCRFQWDPDHLPNGESHVYRRALQIGLKGDLSVAYASRDTKISPILRILDVTPFVREQKYVLNKLKKHSRAQPHNSDLRVARERVYTDLPKELAEKIGVNSFPT